MTAQQSTTKVDINYPKLPECPFCNNAPRHLEVKVGYYTERVICDHCHFHLEGTTTQTAVERWNTRSSEESKYSWDSATQAAPAAQRDAEDAARYRWLIASCESDGLGYWLPEICLKEGDLFPSKVEADTVIDAARSQAKEGA